MEFVSHLTGRDYVWHIRLPKSRGEEIPNLARGEEIDADQDQNVLYV
jgi:hypothetical protein